MTKKTNDEQWLINMEARNIQNAEFVQILPSHESHVTATEAVSGVCDRNIVKLEVKFK